MALLNAAFLADLDILLQYGPEYLSDAECAAQLDKLMTVYYRSLGGSVLKMREGSFWAFHKSELARLGYALDWRRVFIEAIREFASELRSPVTAVRKFKSVALGQGPLPIQESTSNPILRSRSAARHLPGCKGSK